MSVTFVIRSRVNSWLLVFNLQIYCEEKAFLFIMSSERKHYSKASS